MSLSRLRHLVQVAPRPAISHLAQEDQEVTFAPMEALADGLGGLDASRTRPISEVASGSYNFFAEGDLLLAKVTPCFENGKKALAKDLVNGVGFATSEVHVIRPKTSRINPRYLLYVLSAEDFRAAGMASMTGSGGLRRVSDQAILNYRPAVTDLDTQKAIADFLDRETARIDRLIEKKHRLIELSAEKSRIQMYELLDAFGSSVQPQALRWLVRVRSGDFISNTDTEKSPTHERHVPVVGGNGVMAYCDKENSPSQTIVVGRVGALCGNVHFVERPSWVTDNALIVSITSTTLEPAFAVALLKAANLNQKASKSAQPLITGETVKSLKVKVPSKDVQLEVCKILSALTNKLSKLSAVVEESILRLQEFRAALITAAVTGQIDVETWSKRGQTDRRLDQIEEEMSLREARG